LNDPLEMSVRWKQISTEGLRDYMNNRLKETIPEIFSNTDALIEMIKEDFVSKGIALSPHQNAQIEQLLRSDAGKSFIERQLPSAHAFMQMAVDYVFSRIEAELYRY